MLTVVRAQTPEQIATVANLMQDFVSWLSFHYRDHFSFINTYFDQYTWSKELSSLGKTYADPDGSLLLALSDDRPAGCVALRKIRPGICEMKRLFVRPVFQGQGIGRLLATELIRQAVIKGYQTMRLDTGFLQTSAQALYRSLGFVEIAPYYESPPYVREKLVFMELDLTENTELSGYNPAIPMARGIHA
jgi:putative acetyltransferase